MRAENALNWHGLTENAIKNYPQLTFVCPWTTADACRTEKAGTLRRRVCHFVKTLIRTY